MKTVTYADDYTIHSSNENRIKNKRLPKALHLKLNRFYYGKKVQNIYIFKFRMSII